MFFFLRWTIYFISTFTLTATSLFILHTFSHRAAPFVGFVARTTFAYASLVACTTYGIVALVVVHALNLRFAYVQWTVFKLFKYLGSFATGITFDIIDDGEKILDRRHPTVFVLNHQTELDVLLLCWIWPQRCSVTAKKSLRHFPFLGWFLSLAGTIYIDRVDPSAARKAFEDAATMMYDNGHSVLIFPEGTRSYAAKPMLLPFKKGAFHLAVQGSFEIVAIVAANYSHLLHPNLMRFNAGRIQVKGKLPILDQRYLIDGEHLANKVRCYVVLDPISTKGLTSSDVDHLTSTVREKMLVALLSLSEDSN